MSFLKMIFSWWNSRHPRARLLTTWTVRAAAVGTDEFGNRYYQNKDGSRRWVIYNGTVEASRVPPDWHGWLHHTLPSRRPRRRSRPQAWETPHQPNLTGTDGAYRPEGSLAEKRPAPARHRRLPGLEAGMSAHETGMQQNNVAETLIGAVVVAVAVVFLVFAYTAHRLGQPVGL